MNGKRWLNTKCLDGFYITLKKQLLLSDPEFLIVVEEKIMNSIKMYKLNSISIFRFNDIFLLDYKKSLFKGKRLFI